MSVNFGLPWVLVGTERRRRHRQLLLASCVILCLWRSWRMRLKGGIKLLKHRLRYVIDNVTLEHAAAARLYTHKSVNLSIVPLMVVN